MLIELDPADRLTVDAVGPPGQRTFFIQGRSGDHLVTLLLEKQQVQLLAASVVEILSRIGRETGQGPSEDEMSLEEPIMPEWRAGRLSIGYQEQRDMLVLEVEELVPGAEGEDDQEGGEEGEGLDLPSEDEPEAELAPSGEEEPEPQKVRFWATREQMLSLARHGAAVCARGRPRCNLCGNPMDPDGHRCPALNGHQELGRA